MIKIFVYGTLMRGGCYHKQFLAGHKFLGKGVISDYALYDLGATPVLCLKKGSRSRERYTA